MQLTVVISTLVIISIIISYHIGWMMGFNNSSDICDKYHGDKRQ
jgi:hypothetical protein